MSRRSKLVNAVIPEVISDPESDPIGHVSLMGVIQDSLMAQGYTPVGTVSGKIRDEGWGDDISELVSRALPHEIMEPDPVTGDMVLKMVSIDLNTLTVEVDDLGEVCAWIYEES